MRKIHGFTTSCLHPKEIDARLISSWADLEARASVPNAFLSPYFVLPAIDHLALSEDVFGVFVEKKIAGIPSLVGVAMFKVEKPMRRFPLRHLAMFESIHSYLSGFLLDREYASDARRMIYGWLSEKKHKWHGLYIDDCPPEDLFTEEARQIASDFAMQWTTHSYWQRAVLHPKSLDGITALSLSKHMLRDYKRNLHHLQAVGHFEWKLTRGTEPLDKSINEFIRLEHMGWKGTKGTSLYSDPNQFRFFQEMAKGFNQTGRIFFTEIHLDGICIASTANLISGQVGFGFKMGWDPQYSKYSPGRVNLIKIMEHGKDLLSDLEYIDSSTTPESYINKIWPDRRNLVEGMLSLSTLGKTVMASLNVAKKLKRTILANTRKFFHKNLQEKS
jgi:hypothetical protein